MKTKRSLKNNKMTYSDYSSDRKSSVKWIAWGIGILLLISTLGYVLGWFGEAAAVAKEEFGPRAALEKYEWFKDCSAAIEEKKASIKVYQLNVADMDSQYVGIHRKDWDRLDKQQYNQWRAEVTGLKASYNKVVADYNSQSSKFNWESFKGEIPQTFESYKID